MPSRAPRRCFAYTVPLLALVVGGAAVACSGSEAPSPTGEAVQSTAGTTASGNGAGGASGGGAGGSSAIPQGGSTAGSTASGGGGAAPVGGNAMAGTGGGAVGGTSAGGSGDSGGRPSGPSAGCLGPMPEDEPQKAIQHDLMVNGVADKYKPTYVTRKYYTSLPQEFDPKKPYPMIFYGQGCGQVNAESGPFSGGHFAKDAIYVQLIPAVVTGETVVPKGGAPGCFQAGKQGLADSPDGPYFDMVLAEVEQKYCVDRSKVYVAGWSSGAWLANYLACARGNVITGTASGSGGLQYDHGTCTGGSAVMILPGDAGSIQEAGHPIGAQTARDTLVMSNGGATTATAKKFGNADCQVYEGKGPVAWCPGGGGHGDPLGPIADAAWAFWTSLPQ